MNTVHTRHPKMPKKKASHKHFKSKLPGKLLWCAFYLAIIAAVVSLYAFQPAGRRGEINRLTGVYFHNGKALGLMELASDIWTTCFGKTLIPCDTPPDDSPVFGGTPKSDSPLTILHNDAYWVGYSEEKRSPLWAAYRLVSVPENTEIAMRADSFLPDRRTSSQVTSDQYTGSGYDRGHLASSYSIAKCFGDAAQKQTFLMSNVVPQLHALNAGIWKSLEKSVLSL